MISLKLAMLSSNALIKGNYAIYISIIKTKSNECYSKPRRVAKFLHNQQLQYMFLINSIFCLKMCSDWHSLISHRSVCHNFLI